MPPPSTTCPSCGRPLVGLDRRPVRGQLSNQERIRRCPIHGRPPHNDLSSRLYRESTYPSESLDHFRLQCLFGISILFGPVMVALVVPSWAGAVLGPALSLGALLLLLRYRHRYSYRYRRAGDVVPPYRPVAARWALNHHIAASALVVGITAGAAALGARDARVGLGALVAFGIAFPLAWWRDGPLRRVVQRMVPPDPFHDR